MDEFQPSKEFADFFFLAIDHGFRCIEDGCGPLIPFTLTVDRSGKKDLHRYMDEDMERCIEKARASITPLDSIVMYAIAIDGFVTVEGRKWDAIIVEAGEAGQEQGVMFCQRYVPGHKWLFRKVNKRMGNPALIDRPKSRLWAEPSGNS